MSKTGLKEKDGYILVAVLIVVSFLAILALGLGQHFRADARVSAMELARLQSKLRFEAALVHAVIGLGDRDPDKVWTSDGAWHTVRINGEDIKIAIFDEFGKIDINTASPEILTSYLAAFVSDKADVNQLVAALQDWRDGDVEKRPFGAEAATYRLEGRAFLPRNKDFERVSELMWVRGMTGELYRCLSPGLTVHSHRRGIDTFAAHAHVKKALSLPDEEGPGRAVSAIRGGLGGRAFEIIVRVPAKSGETVWHGVLRVTEDRREPFWVLDITRPEIPKADALCFVEDVESDPGPAPLP